MKQFIALVNLKKEHKDATHESDTTHSTHTVPHKSSTRPRSPLLCVLAAHAFPPPDSPDSPIVLHSTSYGCTVLYVPAWRISPHFRKDTVLRSMPAHRPIPLSYTESVVAWSELLHHGVAARNGPCTMHVPFLLAPPSPASHDHVGTFDRM